MNTVFYPAIKVNNTHFYMPRTLEDGVLGHAIPNSITHFNKKVPGYYFISRAWW